MIWDMYWCDGDHWVVVQRIDEAYPIEMVITCPLCSSYARHKKVVREIDGMMEAKK